MVWGFFGKKEEPKGPTKEELEEMARKKEEKRIKELQEKLLPWGTKQKVEICLNFVKIPLIIFVMVLGSYTENRLTKATVQTWESSDWTKTCYVHKVDMQQWQDTMFNHSFGNIMHLFNETFTNETWCKQDPEEDAMIKCEIIDTAKWGYNLTWEKDHCGIMEASRTPHQGLEEEICTVDDNEIDGKLVPKAKNKDEVGQGGIARRYSALPGPLVWGLYKLVFLPFHPVDRIVKLFSDSDPPPEPVFKLMTEPYFQKFTGAMTVLVLFVKYFRYTALPNSLITPLRTLTFHPNCEMFFHYKIDTWLGYRIYQYMILEMLTIVGMYVLGKALCHSKLVGTMGYRAYKTYWLCTAGIALGMFSVEVFSTFDYRFWLGMDLVIRRNITFDLKMRFQIDTLKTLSGLVVFLDAVSLLVLILSIFCPILLQKLGSKLAVLPGAGMYQRLTGGSAQDMRTSEVGDAKTPTAVE